MGKLGEKISRRLLPSFMLISSLILLYFGVPRFLAELMLVPGTPVHERLSRGEEISDEDLTLLEESRLNALKFVDHPEAYSDLGGSYLYRAKHAKTPEEKAKYAQMTIDAAMTGLKMAPLNTFSWLRVCSANFLLGEEHYDKAVEAWRMSVKTAPFEPFVLLSRIHYGILLYNRLTVDDVVTLNDQFDMAYRWSRGKLRSYMNKNNLQSWAVFLAEPDQEMVDFFRK